MCGVGVSKAKARGRREEGRKRKRGRGSREGGEGKNDLLMIFLAPSTRWPDRIAIDHVKSINT